MNHRPRSSSGSSLIFSVFISLRRCIWELLTVSVELMLDPLCSEFPTHVEVQVLFVLTFF